MAYVSATQRYRPFQPQDTDTVATNQPAILRFAAILVAVSGFVRLAGPAPARRPQDEAKKETLQTKRVTSSYDTDLERTVLQFFGKERAPDEVLNSNDHWDLPPERQKVRFVIATLADPVHTHLGLLFDRSIAAIQLAAQRRGYVFDRAILPWERAPHQDTDLDKRQKEIEEQRIREAFPGLLIFRAGTGRNHPDPLFVFIVGETPTGGIRSHQFREALMIAAKIRGKDVTGKDVLNDEQLSILGPAFSGSLVSLDQELDRAMNGGLNGAVGGLKNKLAPKLQRPVIFSGSVSDSTSIDWFEKRPSLKSGQFASFQQNDHYIVQRLVDLVCAQHYNISEIAILSEDNTVYGAGAGKEGSGSRSPDFTCPNYARNFGQPLAPRSPLYLHFPREISFFRSAYQKATAAQSQQEKNSTGRTTLTLDLEDTGSDDDTVAPYGGAQTPLSQEAVMLGIASELQKHHVKFTVLFATDPVDQLFLARYLRTAYPEGRVIVTVPDLLFTREEDTLLHGVLGLSSYAMVPGLSDQLCQQEDPPSPTHDLSAEAHNHEDRLFSSSLTVGVFNAMLGLLSLQDTNAPAVGHTDAAPTQQSQTLPAATYAEYAGLPNALGGCSQSALVWLTILGRDGFWPVAPLDADLLQPNEKGSTLQPTAQAAALPVTMKANTPQIWKTFYYFCLLMMLAHALLSWTGSTLDESEASAQFARSNDCRTAIVIGAGALVLLVAFVALLFARSPFLAWREPWEWTVLLWMPMPLFALVTFWDLARLREQRAVAIVFLLSASLVSLYLLAFDLPPRSHIYWLPRVAHISSTVSPVVPFLLLLCGGYWWTWQSLRGVTLVDLRRPRLPELSDLPPDSYRISDADAEALRETAHPFYFQWQVWVPVVALIPFAFTVIDVTHPVQTVEGFAFDIGYSLLLGLMLAVFLGCLLKLTRTWFAFRHILLGLDRIALRRAFGRMKEISWHSMWNPGGSTLRETYKVMSKALDNLNRLKAVLSASKSGDQASELDTAIGDTTTVVSGVQKIFKEIHPESKTPPIDYGQINTAATSINLQVEPVRDLNWWERKPAEAEQILMAGVALLQKKMARTAGLLMRDVLRPMWLADRSPVVSSGKDVDDAKAEHAKKSKLPQSVEHEPKPQDPAAGSAAPAAVASPFVDPLSLQRVLAEEYVALIYVNFIVTVLLRIRTMIICAIGLYVFLVLSVNTYPFEPHPALQTQSVLLIILLGAAVAFVYSEMHRDPILSRLADSEPGELGWDFWLKLISAAALPLFSLLATQFPEINQLLTSWLQPALEAVK
jgi:hypothetical protein